MSSKNGSQITRPIEEKMLRLLMDGAPHTRRELFTCLYEQDAPLSNIRMHISSLRKRVREYGMEIVCELRSQRSVNYRLVRLLQDSDRAVLPIS